MMANDNWVPAGFWRRFLALLVDSVLAGLVLFPILSMLGVNDDITKINQAGLGSTAVWNLPFIVVAALFVYYRQATPGKMLLGLEVRDARTLEKPSMGQALGRQFAYIVSFVPFCLGFLWIAFDDRKQGWHDKLASTVVVKRR